MTATLPQWFAAVGRPQFECFLLPRRAESLHCLQIGAFTGDASVWLMENLPNATLDDVDPFTGSETIEHLDFEEVLRVYNEKVLPYRPRLTTFGLTSEQYFTRPLGNLGRFDFVYIDGEHLAPTVLADAVHSFERLRPGGLIAFDDYTWESGAGELHNPRVAIDAFLSVYGEWIEVLEIGVQVWIRRRT